MFRSIADNPLLLLVLVLLIVVIFGAKKLPTAARSLGQSLKIFKSEVRDVRSDDRDGAPGHPGQGSAAADGLPLEGRVVHDPPPAQSAPASDVPHRSA